MGETVEIGDQIIPLNIPPLDQLFEIFFFHMTCQAKGFGAFPLPLALFFVVIIIFGKVTPCMGGRDC
jgi:hypothetical protein